MNEKKPLHTSVHEFHKQQAELRKSKVPTSQKKRHELSLMKYYVANLPGQDEQGLAVFCSVENERLYQPKSGVLSDSVHTIGKRCKGI